MKNENYDDNENSMTAEEFLDFMRKNRRTVPNEKRIANKDKFIWAVSELSETYEIDADLIEDDDGYYSIFYQFFLEHNANTRIPPRTNGPRRQQLFITDQYIYQLHRIRHR